MSCVNLETYGIQGAQCDHSGRKSIGVPITRRQSDGEGISIGTWTSKIWTTKKEMAPLHHKTIEIQHILRVSSLNLYLKLNPVSDLFEFAFLA